MPRLLARHGDRWGVRDVADPGSAPLFLALLAVLSLPGGLILFNSIIRHHESEADAFGLEAAREPDGFAMTAMQLSEYRKIEPRRWEEMLFYDHPSGRTRVDGDGMEGEASGRASAGAAPDHRHDAADDEGELSRRPAPWRKLTPAPAKREQHAAERQHRAGDRQRAPAIAFEQRSTGSWR